MLPKTLGLLVALVSLVPLLPAAASPAWGSGRAEAATPVDGPSLDDLVADLRDAREGVRLASRERLLGMARGEGGEVVATALLSALGDDSYRVRLGSAWVIARSGDARAPEALAAALLAEPSETARSELARSLLILGDVGREAVASLRGDLGNLADSLSARKAWETYVEEAVLSVLSELLEGVTGIRGEVKGFFADPVRELEPLYADAVQALVLIVENPSYSVLFRSLATRALAEIDRREVVPRLLAVHQDLQRMCTIRRFREEPWRLRFLPRNNDEEELLDFRKYVSQTLARLGAPEPFLARLEPMLRLEEEFDAHIREVELDLASFRKAQSLGMPDEALRRLEARISNKKEDLLYFLLQVVQLRWFLAYEYQQVRGDEESIRLYHRAIDAGRKLQSIEEREVREIALAYYNMGCIEARRSRATEALEHLAKAFENGFGDLAWIARDRDLDPVRDDPRFKKLLSTQGK